MDKQERRKGLKKDLERLAGDLVLDPEKIEEFSKQWQSGFWRYSFGNQLLIQLQFPGASLCAGFKTWSNNGRFVVKGSRAIYVLAPREFIKKEEVEDPETGETLQKEKKIRYFVDVPIFAYEQTDGQELNIGHADKINGPADLDLEELSKLFGIPVEISQGVENGWTDGKKIVLSKRENETAMLSCFFHEMAHVMLGHAESFFDQSSEVKELQAESVAYIVDSCLGIQNEKARYYIASWRGDAEMIKKSALKILDTAEKILNKIHPEKKRSFPVPAEES